MNSNQPEGYKWPERCCMSTLRGIMQVYGIRTDATDRILSMSEGEAIKRYLKLYKNLRTAYSAHLLQNGFVDSSRGIVAVVDAKAIRTVDGAVHYPKGKLQVMAFQALNGFTVWTEAGLSLIDQVESEQITFRRFLPI